MNIRPATPADIPHIARVHMESWQNTYRGLLSDDFLDNLRLEDRILRWEQRLIGLVHGEFAYVAEDVGGDVIAFASAGPEHTGHPIYKGELWALHVLKPYQGLGLGKKLFGAVAKRMQEIGYTNIMLWVIAGNPAQKFYEKLGGIPIMDRVEEGLAGNIPEVAIGYADLNSLIEATE